MLGIPLEFNVLIIGAIIIAVVGFLTYLINHFKKGAGELEKEAKKQQKQAKKLEKQRRKEAKKLEKQRRKEEAKRLKQQLKLQREEEAKRLKLQRKEEGKRLKQQREEEGKRLRQRQELEPTTTQEAAQQVKKMEDIEARLEAILSQEDAAMEQKEAAEAQALKQAAEEVGKAEPTEKIDESLEEPITTFEKVEEELKKPDKEEQRIRQEVLELLDQAEGFLRQEVNIRYQNKRNFDLLKNAVRTLELVELGEERDFTKELNEIKQLQRILFNGVDYIRAVIKIYEKKLLEEKEKYNETKEKTHIYSIRLVERSINKLEKKIRLNSALWEHLNNKEKILVYLNHHLSGLKSEFKNLLSVEEYIPKFEEQIQAETLEYFNEIQGLKQLVQSGQAIDISQVTNTVRDIFLKSLDEMLKMSEYLEKLNESFIFITKGIEDDLNLHKRSLVESIEIADEFKIMFKIEQEEGKENLFKRIERFEMSLIRKVNTISDSIEGVEHKLRENESEIKKHIKNLESEMTTLQKLKTDKTEHQAPDEDMERLYQEAVQILNEIHSVSTFLLMRRLRISYNKARQIIKRMEREGLISKNIRKILV